MIANGGFPSLQSAAKRLLRSWEVLQVELHGKYPLERIKALNAYSNKSTLLRVLGVCLFTPLPCIILVTLEDFIPLNAPKRGIFDNYVFWLRDCIAVAFVTIAILEQFRQCLPRLPLSNTAIAAITLVATAAGVGSQFSFAYWIGFPLPFSALFGELMWTPAVVVSCAFLWGKRLLRDRTLIGEMLEYVMVLLCQVMLTLVYPAYIFEFTRLTGWSQTAFVLMLPVMKIVAKNWIAHYLNDLDHLKPEAVIFNVDVFSALYVSCSLMTQSSTSTTAVVMAVDLVQILISIIDINCLNTELRSILSRVSDGAESCTSQSILDVCAELLEDARVFDSSHFKPARRETRIYKLSRVMSSNTLSIVPSQSFTPQDTLVSGVKQTARVTKLAANQTRVGPAPTKPTIPTVSTVRDVQIVRPKDSQSRLDTVAITDRVLFVDTAAKMLFLTEFVLLVEFTEVMMPVIYTMYLVVMSRVPNRQFYPRLAAVSDDDLAETITSVLTLAALELVSLIGFATVIYRKLRISPLHQVAFVLDKQFASVQSKLILWMFYVVQTMLVHFGVDFSMRFEWLRHQQKPL